MIRDFTGGEERGSGRVTTPQLPRYPMRYNRAYPSRHSSIPVRTPRRERCRHVREVACIRIDRDEHEEEREDQRQPTPHPAGEEVRGA